GAIIAISGREASVSAAIFTQVWNGRRQNAFSDGTVFQRWERAPAVSAEVDRWLGLQARLWVASRTYHHAVNPWRLGAAVQRADAVVDPGVRERAPLDVAHIVVPGRHVVGFHPLFRMLGIAQQFPLPRPVAAADASAFVHGE